MLTVNTLALLRHNHVFGASAGHGPERLRVDQSAHRQVLAR